MEGRVVSRIKGGTHGRPGRRQGVLARLPDRSAAGPNFDQLIGQTFQMRILKMNARRGNIVLSRRVLLEEERNKRKEQTLGTLKDGQVVRGTVKNLTGVRRVHRPRRNRRSSSHHRHVLGTHRPPVGDLLGGRQGGRRRPQVRPGAREGFARVQAAPAGSWSQVGGKYPVGKRVRGKVVSLAEYGAFVELEPGIEGLVHVSEMSWTHKVRHPSKLVSVADLVDAVVLNVDPNNKRISLGMKQAEPNPWDTIARRYPIGTRVEGKVRTSRSSGRSSGSKRESTAWFTSRISRGRATSSTPRRSSRGAEGRRRRSSRRSGEEDLLGIKQGHGGSWESLIPETYTVGKSVKGRLSVRPSTAFLSRLRRGSKVSSTPRSLTGRGRKSGQPERGRRGHGGNHQVDTAERKIGLSMRTRQRSTDREAMGEYNQGQQSLSTTLGSLLREKGI